MKRIALVAAAAILAAPAVFAQTVIVSEPASHVLNLGSVAVTPPVDGGPGTPLMIISSPVAIDSSNTAILGGPSASFSSASSMTIGSTALLDVPNHATSRPDFQRWLAWEGSRMAR